MVEKLHQNDHFIVDALKRGNIMTDIQIRDYLKMKIKNFYFGMKPDWWQKYVYENYGM